MAAVNELIGITREVFKMLNDLITPMVFTLVRDSICQLIADERDNQIKIAIKAGKTNEEISQDFDFTVYPKRFRIPDVQDMPCVYAYFNRMEFPQDEQAINENYALGNFVIEFYCCGENSTVEDSEGNIYEKTADENAEDRLNYLSSQLYKILCSEQNVCKGTNKVVNHIRLKSWQRILTPDELNQTSTVLGGSFEFELGFNEPAYYNDTIKIKEFYTTLHIRDEFIDPFVRIILDSDIKDER